MQVKTHACKQRTARYISHLNPDTCAMQGTPVYGATERSVSEMAPVIKVKTGNLEETSKMMQGVQVETFGGMEQEEKFGFVASVRPTV